MSTDMVQYPFSAVCKYCSEELRFDIDPSGTPGQNGDWGALFPDPGFPGLDYGCGESPDTDEDGTGGHWPTSIRWHGYEEE
jgi:hypothetical protein